MVAYKLEKESSEFPNVVTFPIKDVKVTPNARQAFERRLGVSDHLPDVKTTKIGLEHSPKYDAFTIFRNTYFRVFDGPSKKEVVAALYSVLLQESFHEIEDVITGAFLHLVARTLVLAEVRLRSLNEHLAEDITPVRHRLEELLSSGKNEYDYSHFDQKRVDEAAKVENDDPIPDLLPLPSRDNPDTLFSNIRNSTILDGYERWKAANNNRLTHATNGNACSNNNNSVLEEQIKLFSEKLTPVFKFTEDLMDVFVVLLGEDSEYYEHDRHALLIYSVLVLIKHYAQNPDIRVVINNDKLGKDWRETLALRIELARKFAPEQMTKFHRADMEHYPTIQSGFNGAHPLTEDLRKLNPNAWRLEMGPFMGGLASGFLKALAEKHNRMMHSTNGNIETKVIIKKGKQEKVHHHQKKKTVHKPKVHKPKVVKTFSPPGSMQSDKAKLRHEVSVMKQVQKRVPAGLSKELNLAEKVASSIMLPGISPVERYGSAFSAARTAVAALRARPNVNYAAPGAVDMPNTSMFAVVRRDIALNNIIYDGNPTGLSYTYNFMAEGDSGSVSSAPNITVNTAPAPYRVQYISTSNPSNYSPHGPIAGVGIDGKTARRYVWMDLQTITRFNLGLASAATITFIRYKWSPADPIYIDKTVISAGATQAQVINAVSGYYSFDLQSSVDTMPIQLTTSISGGGPVFCHLTAPNLTNNTAAIDSARIISTAMMYTTTAADLNNQGQIAGKQVGQGVHWLDIAKGGWNLLASDQDAYAFDIKHGMYGFLKPSQSTDFDLQDTVRSDGNGNLISLTYPIRPGADFLVYFASVNITAGQSAYWSIWTNLEYMTRDVWRTTAKPKCRDNHFKQGMEMIQQGPQFTENSIHIKAVIAAIRRGVKATTDAIAHYGPGVMRAAAAVGELL